MTKTQAGAQERSAQREIFEMSSFLRKIKRGQQKTFMKDFKKSMRNFKKQVVCSECSRAPFAGENIDNWHINQKSNNIDLICPDCYVNEEEEVLEGV